MWGKRRFIDGSMQNRVYSCNYSLIVVLFSIRTIVNLRLPHPVYSATQEIYLYGTLHFSKMLVTRGGFTKIKHQLNADILKGKI